MSREVPKIEWLNVEIDGTSAIGSDTITAISSTALIQVGMNVRGNGIPDNTTVLSKTASTVVLSNNSTAAGTFTFEYYFLFEFRHPPDEDDNEEIVARKRVSTSISGQTQSAIDHFEARFDPEFWFIEEYERAALENFMLTHFGFGKPFRYYPDKEVATYVTYEARKYEFKFRKQTPKPVYRIKMSFRRVLA